MIHEFPSENRCEVITPTCRCGRYMERDFVKAKMGADNLTKQKGGQTYLESLTASPNMTMLNMGWRCKKHPQFIARLSINDIVIMNKYPTNNIKFVNREGREI